MCSLLRYYCLSSILQCEQKQEQPSYLYFLNFNCVDHSLNISQIMNEFPFRSLY